MLCPRCSSTSTKREREGGQCPKCKRAFVFDPPAPLSDFEIDKAIKALSKNGAHKFTREQLVCEIERHIVALERKNLDLRLAGIEDNTAIPWVFVVLGIFAAGIMVLVEFWPVVVLATIAVGIAIVRLATRRDPAELRREALAEKEARVSAPNARTVVDLFVASDPPAALLPDALAHAEPTYRKRAREFDLESFGFDRVVVVQHDHMVDMLVANRFHFDHNAAVVSFGGYPEHVAAIVKKQMESGHTKAHVFLVHDASVEGFRLAEAWRGSGWAQKAAMVRVGLTPKQAAGVLPRRTGVRSSAPLGDIPPADAEWLGANSVSLWALRPLQAMTLIFNAMTAADKLERDASTTTDHGVIGFIGFDSVSDTSFDFG